MQATVSISGPVLVSSAMNEDTGRISGGSESVVAVNSIWRWGRRAFDGSATDGYSISKEKYWFSSLDFQFNPPDGKSGVMTS